VVNTYNLEVRGTGTYFVGAGGVWVHNSGADCKATLGGMDTVLNKRAGSPTADGYLASLKAIVVPGPNGTGVALLTKSLAVRKTAIMHATTKCFKNAITKRPDGTYDVRLEALPSYHTLKKQRDELRGDQNNSLPTAIEIHHLAPKKMIAAYLDQVLPGGFRPLFPPNDPILDGKGWTPSLGITPIPAFPLEKWLHRLGGDDAFHRVLESVIDPREFIRTAPQTSPAVMKFRLRRALWDTYDELKRLHPDIPEADFDSMRIATDAWLNALP
jgi:hypothetical protein